MEYNVQKLADMGRFEDDQLAHVATGEMIVPPVISPNTRMMIEQDMLNQGMDPNQYIVGGNPSINPRTGLQEFFIKKLFKKIKKVVKKVAPVAAIGLGVAGFAGAGPLGKFLGKGAAKATSGKIFGAGGKFRAGLGGFFNPAKGTPGIFGGKIGPGIRRGLGVMFRPGQQLQQVTAKTGEFGEPVYTFDDGTEVSAAQLQEMGYTFDASGNPIAPTQTTGETGTFGGTLGPRLRKTFLGDANTSGSFFGRKTPDSIKGIEDKIKGVENKGLMGLAALFGLATKRAAEKTEGGLRDIRLSTRPDLMPQQVFQGFDTGVRPGMSYGGALGYRLGMSYGGPMDEDELDLRIGGPSIGPGTETSDDIPAMLSDGEFVMTADANKGLGGFKIEKNKDSLTIFPAGKPDREQGFKNNDMLMKFFENYQNMMS